MPNPSQSNLSSDGTRSHWLSRTEIGVIVAFWLGVYVLYLVGIYVEKRGSTAHALLNLVRFGTWMVITPFIFWMGRRFPFRHTNRWRHAILHLGVGVLIATLYSIFGGIMRNYFLVEPGKRDALRVILSEAVSFVIISPLFRIGGIFAVGRALDYYRRTQRQKTELKEARLQALRMQLNPHFLFNALNTVSMLTKRDPRAARRVVARLSNLLRHALEENEESEIPLRSELDFLESYLDIVRHRLEDRLEIRWSVEETVRDALVPDLILQPLVENAVQHGIGQRAEKGVIEIEALREGDDLLLRVRDNGPGWSGDGASGRGTGLQNTRERLHTMYGERGTLVLRESPQGGVEGEIRLPYHVTSDLRAKGVPNSPRHDD
jgi:sensor histidine kinase YesM